MKTIYLLSDATTGWVTNHSLCQEGFSNFSNQTKGYAVILTNVTGGKKLEVSTDKIHVKYSISGASVNSVFLSALNNVNEITFKYEYLIQ